MARLGGTNARDIRMELQSRADPKLVGILCDLAERQDHLYGLLEQVAHAMDQLANGMLAQGNAVTALTKAHDAAKAAKAMGIKVDSENPAHGE